MNNYLIFRLYGALVSWGDIAVGGVRPSHRYPTKSAVLGLLAAALGIKRNEEEKLQTLQNEIGFAVCIDHNGTLVIDYHTAQVPSTSSLKNRPHFTRRDELTPELNTVLSTREYYCDAIYTIVLWSREESHEFDLEKIEEALNYPKFILYLGRKSCPISLPIKPINIAAEDAEKALKIADKELLIKDENILSKLKRNKKKPFYWENQQSNLIDDTTYKHRHIRKDALKNRQRWQYQDREEFYKLIQVNEE